jgi:adenosylcobinamide-GDP ribazoletransferase
MRAFLTAVQFLTRLPVPGGGNPVDPATLARAPVFFPLVGAAIGLFTAGALEAVARGWPLPVAVAAALAAEALLTGALHEDAVADFCDAFGGGTDAADIHRILADSRIGSYGALGLTLAVLLRGGSMAALPPPLLLPAIVAAATLGRWSMVILMAILPPPPDHPSLARGLARRLGPGHLAAVTLLAAPGTAALAFLAPWRLLAALLAVAVLLCGAHRYLRRRLGGATGDGLGAVGYAAQLVVLLAAGFHPGGTP